MKMVRNWKYLYQSLVYNLFTFICYYRFVEIKQLTLPGKGNFQSQ